MANPRKYRRFTPGRGLTHRTIVRAVKNADLTRIDGETLLKPGEVKVFNSDLNASLRTYEQRKNFNRLVGSGTIRVTRIPMDKDFAIREDGEVEIILEDDTDVGSSESEATVPSSASSESSETTAESYESRSSQTEMMLYDGFDDEEDDTFKGSLTSETSSFDDEDDDETPSSDDRNSDGTSQDQPSEEESQQGSEEGEESSRGEEPEDGSPASEEQPPAVDPLLGPPADDTVSDEDKIELLMEIDGIGKATAKKLIALENPTARDISGLRGIHPDKKDLHEEILNILTA